MQFVFTLHVLQEGQHPPELRHDGGLKAGAIIRFDQTTQALVQNRPDLHAKR